MDNPPPPNWEPHLQRRMPLDVPSAWPYLTLALVLQVLLMPAWRVLVIYLRDDILENDPGRAVIDYIEQLLTGLMYGPPQDKLEFLAFWVAPPLVLGLVIGAALWLRALIRISAGHG